MAGVMALIFAIVYKMNNRPSAAIATSGLSVPQSADEITGTIALPEGAQISSYSLSGNQILFDVILPDGKREMILFDIAQSRIAARYVLTNVK
ncbi:MAG: fimbrial protein, partial [Rhizobiaceae bacterium]